MATPSRTYRTTIIADDDTTMTAIDVRFNPKAVFGKVRAPVMVTINGYTYRSTIFSMGGKVWIPLRGSNREAAGVVAGQTVTVTVTLDEAPRVVEAPADLRKALHAAGAVVAWKKLSCSHRREHVEAIEEAKKPETRARRIAKCVEMVAGRSD